MSITSAPTAAAPQATMNSREPTTIRIATRGSALALWQARWVRSRLEAQGAFAELVIVETQGDREKTAFRDMRGQGFFTKAVQEAVQDGRADIAVHSLKDLPSAAAPGLVIAAIPEREDARDAILVRRDAADASAPALPMRTGARIGSSAVRRQAQVAHLRPDLERLELRGNVPTRVEKLRRGEYDAILLAAAGLNRLALDLGDLEVRVLEPRLFVPAPGQGALALECRSDDARTIARLAPLEDKLARLTVNAERGLMARLQGGCQLALGASASVLEDGVALIAWYEGRLYETRAADADAAIGIIHERLRLEHGDSVAVGA